VAASATTTTGGGRGRLANALVKVAVDQALAAPAYTYAYYVITNAVGAAAATSGAALARRDPAGESAGDSPEEGKRAPLAKVLSGAHDKAVTKLGPTMLQHYKVWPLVHTANFYYVPLQHRVLVQNGVLVFWSAYLSHLNHGEDHGRNDDHDTGDELRLIDAL
jgi:hypothetical protein